MVAERVGFVIVDGWYVKANYAERLRMLRQTRPEYAELWFRQIRIDPTYVPKAIKRTYARGENIDAGTFKGNKIQDLSLVGKVVHKAKQVEKDLSVIVRVLGKDKVADASREYVEKPQPKVPGRRR